MVLLGLFGLALLTESSPGFLVEFLALSGLLVWFLVSNHNEHLLKLSVLRRYGDEMQVSREGLQSSTTPKDALRCYQLWTLVRVK